MITRRGAGGAGEYMRMWRFMNMIINVGTL